MLSPITKKMINNFQVSKSEALAEKILSLFIDDIKAGYHPSTDEYEKIKGSWTAENRDKNETLVIEAALESKSEFIKMLSRNSPKIFKVSENLYKGRAWEVDYLPQKFTLGKGEVNIDTGSVFIKYGRDEASEELRFKRNINEILLDKILWLQRFSDNEKKKLEKEISSPLFKLGLDLVKRGEPNKFDLILKFEFKLKYENKRLREVIDLKDVEKLAELKSKSLWVALLSSKEMSSEAVQAKNEMINIEGLDFFIKMKSFIDAMRSVSRDFGQNAFFDQFFIDTYLDLCKKHKKNPHGSLERKSLLSDFEMSYETNNVEFLNSRLDALRNHGLMSTVMNEVNVNLQKRSRNII